MYYYTLLLSALFLCEDIEDHATLNTWNITELVFLQIQRITYLEESTSLSSASFIIFCDLELHACVLL